MNITEGTLGPGIRESVTQVVGMPTERASVWRGQRVQVE